MGSGYLHPDEQSAEIYNESTMEPIMLIWPSHYYGHTLDTRILLFFCGFATQFHCPQREKNLGYYGHFILSDKNPRQSFSYLKNPFKMTNGGQGLRKT